MRGTCVLPQGTGQEIKVAVFADKEFHEQLKALGTDIIGDDDLLKSITEGEI